LGDYIFAAEMYNQLGAQGDDQAWDRLDKVVAEQESRATPYTGEFFSLSVEPAYNLGQADPTSRSAWIKFESNLPYYYEISLGKNQAMPLDRAVFQVNGGTSYRLQTPFGTQEAKRWVWGSAMSALLVGILYIDSSN